MEAKRSAMAPRSLSVSKPSSDFSARAMSMSVTFVSPLPRLPGAETTTTRLSLSASMMSQTLVTWAASATDEPPNLHTFIVEIPYNRFLILYYIGSVMVNYRAIGAATAPIAR